MIKILIFFAGLFVGVLAVSLGEAAREKKPPKKPPLIIKQDARVVPVSAFLFLPKDGSSKPWPRSPQQYLAEKIGLQLLDDHLLEIHAVEGEVADGTFYKADVRVIDPKKEEEQ